MGTSRQGRPTMGRTDTREPDMSLTDESSETEPDLRRRRGSGERLIIASSVVVTVLAIAGIANLVLDGDEPTAPRPPASAAVEEPADAAPVERPPTEATPEDLAAAEAQASYRNYIRVTDQVAQGGYADLALYNTVAIDPETGALLQDAAQLADITTTGDTEVVSLSVQSVDMDPPGQYPSVRLLACLDVSQVTAVNAVGESVVPPDRPDRLRSEAVVQNIPPDAFTDGREPGWYVAELVQRGETC